MPKYRVSLDDIHGNCVEFHAVVEAASREQALNRGLALAADEYPRNVFAGYAEEITSPEQTEKHLTAAVDALKAYNDTRETHLAWRCHALDQREIEGW